MSLKPVVDAFERAPAVRDLGDRLPGRGGTLRLGGLPGSSAAALAAWLVRTYPQRLLTVMTPSPADAERWLSDLAQLSDVPTALYPQREALGEDEPHYEIAGERAETIQALLEGRLRILVTTARASAERTLLPAALQRLSLRLAVGDSRPPAEVARSLEAMGYQRVPTVSEVAEFSVRGGILDLYGFGMATPARLEWWGDEITSLRGFDLTTQRSLQQLSDITVLPINTQAVREEADEQAERRNGGKAVDATSTDYLPTALPTYRQTLLELRPPDTLLIQ
jgi:transcription-repair coupling factor (superfamily II helicase)